MKIAPRRLTAIAIVLAAVAVSGAAAFGEWPLPQTLVVFAIVWLLMVGWGFHTLLARHLHFSDQLACTEMQLGMERHTRLLAERTLGDTHAALCRLIGQQEQVRERERNRIARDIHDDLGQHLLAMKIELSLMQVSTNGAHPQVHQKIGRLLHNVDLTVASLRAIINDLRPLALELGLHTAMRAHLCEFSRLNGIRHELEADPEAFPANPDRSVDAMLFRVLQESLANVARHSQATEVKIALTRSGDQLTLKVRDNGIGMAGQPSARGSGLAGIAERVTAAGGKFVIDSQPGAGTLLCLSIPLSRPVATY